MKNETSYPYEWAAIVVHEFMEKYARGVKIYSWHFSKQSEELRSRLIEELRKNQIQWRMDKEIIKEFDALKKQDVVYERCSEIVHEVLHKWRALTDPGYQKELFRDNEIDFMPLTGGENGVF